jgi:formamidopyrimidine-DNA glycosylase
MPELPEVETVRNELLHQLKLPLKLDKISFNRQDLRNKFNTKLLKSFEGQNLKTITRRSKYLLFWFEKGGILSHLGMTGHWRIEEQDFKPRKHDHIQMDFASHQSLIYNDPRRFGFFDAFTDMSKHLLLKNIGPEPLDDQFTGKVLWENLKSRSGPIKNILMNQAVVAGVGNIYASEVLFKAGIKPSKAASKLKIEECDQVVTELKSVLLESIRLGGSSFDDFRHVSGEKGDFQNHFLVYDQEGKACPQCGRKIRKDVHAGRSTYWCGFCQR